MQSEWLFLVAKIFMNDEYKFETERTNMFESNGCFLWSQIWYVETARNIYLYIKSKSQFKAAKFEKIIEKHVEK